MKDRNGMSLDKNTNDYPWELDVIEPLKPTKKKREPMSISKKLWLVGLGLIILGALVMLSSVPLGLIGVWSGDERWSVTGVVMFFTGLFTALLGGMMTDLNRRW